MRNLNYGTDPVRWWVVDDAVRTVPVASIPPEDWSGCEARYDNDCESGKRTTRDLRTLPAIAQVLAALRSPASVSRWSALLGYPVEDDPTLHGGGLHITGWGGHLTTHLDYDRHPLLPGKRRALNLIAFIHDRWKPEWDGAFVLCDPMGGVVKRIEPRPGRMVAFECGDLSYHGVEQVGAAVRVSVAAYLLADATAANTRRRALFLPPR